MKTILLLALALVSFNVFAKNLEGRTVVLNENAIVKSGNLSLETSKNVFMMNNRECVFDTISYTDEEVVIPAGTKMTIYQDTTVQTSPSDELGITLGHALDMETETNPGIKFRLVCSGKRALTIGLAKLSVPKNMVNAFDLITFLELK